MKTPAALVMFLAALIGGGPLAAQSIQREVVQLDMLDGGMTPRGTYLAAFRLTLADGWKTYWRAPGDAGIPPEVVWSGAENIGSVAMAWPTPHVFEQAGYRSIGYTRQVVLPVEITPRRDGGPLRLRGTLELGVCSDVCVPASLHFDHVADLDARPNPAIAAALANQPYTAAEAKVKAARCRLRPSADGLHLTATLDMPSAGAPETVVIEPGAPAVWASETEARREGGALVAEADLVQADGKPFALDRSAVRITVLGSRHAVDIRGCAAD
ncbi:protein-disulfide reductase DsbD domain-containing protein [Seohaeicola nanhaiensis]|uniref:Protein-disulfide reductase DsbD domain-containing protein n=1 Tax=Seohaeicola nanhaiensis TaxID=1387282 RepID=A0ABV9KCU6_9RHOB